MESSPLISAGLPIALFIIMIGIGMTLTIRDFRQVAVYPKGMIVGTIAQILVMPLIAFMLATLLAVPPAIAVGLVIIAACPGGTTSNLFVLLSRGNIALSIVLTVSASLITILTLPLFTNIALQYYMGTEEDIVLPVWKTVGMLIGIVLFPVAIGMVVRTRKPEVARKAEGIVSIFGGIVLAVLIVALVYGVRDQIWELLKQAGPATILLNLAGIGLGLAAGRMAGLTQRESLAVAVELGVKNGTIALMVTLTLLESSAMSIPAAVYGVLMFPIGFVLAMYGRSIIPISTVQSKN
ncbi:bile acid:Na+ symporter, BASS family [Marinobacter sp. DSM 26671]|uniref:Bile acid:sodium symporter n=1 Tax=Marinobacter adhaerens TaxID=1033846 RepID=A0A352IRI1_9GAMM|nr:bile acid:sodium symporter family protein [Marinobacter sp. DSM 26671]MEC7727559.1 bile acid:sodium symporter family protein [Pseudomonadota bacterium]HAP52073.1 bile acid:sodium symporter [Marinobacter adhaerens]SFE51517.1 bile acid:Na+ symporter, BASS family [Marinobacter sp. DSM 26671]HAS78082.1 bile acid:sodium symporter [Marinobacter adhaerens]HBC34064.1 bile acid:sodium symporter [Marinobacter adhaerens]